MAKETAVLPNHPDLILSSADSETQLTQTSAGVLVVVFYRRGGTAVQFLAEHKLALFSEAGLVLSWDLVHPKKTPQKP